MSEQESDDSATAAKILWVTAGSGQTLLTSDALSDFDAVVVDQLIEVWGLPPEMVPPPGYQRETDQTYVAALRQRLSRRTQEAAALLARGGILIVRLFPLSSLTASDRHPWVGQPSGERISSADWWLALDQRWSWMNSNPTVAPALNRASGLVAHVDDPAHVLEGYLRASRYQATLTQMYIEGSGAHVLATNRGGEALAIQRSIGAGLLLLLPPDGPDSLLADGLRKLIDLRGSLTSEWPLPAEIAAFAHLQEVERQLQDLRRQAEEDVLAVLATKRRIMQDPTAIRATDAYRSALSPGTSRQQALARLYSATELIQESLGGEGQMIATLGVTKGTVERIKHSANDPTVQVRHMAPGATREIDDKMMREATAAAQEIVFAYLEWLFQNDGQDNC